MKLSTQIGCPTFQSFTRKKRQVIKFGKGIFITVLASLLTQTLVGENLLSRANFDDTQIGDQPRDFHVLGNRDGDWDVKVSDGGTTPGGQALSARRISPGSDAWIQQRPPHPLTPGTLYKFSAVARTTTPGARITLWYEIDVGEKRITVTETFVLSERYENYTMYFSLPEIVDLPGIENERSFFRIRFRGVNTFEYLDILIDEVAAMKTDEVEGLDVNPPTYTADPDPIHSLNTFVERAGIKPYDLFETGNSLKTNRVIFTDKNFGTQIWMVDDSPVIDHLDTASVWTAWNTDGSRLHLTGFRPSPTSGGTNAGWLTNPDYSLLTPAPNARLIWNPDDPDIYYWHSSGRLREGNVRTGQSRVLAEWDPYPRERVYGLTADNRYIFLDTPNGGQWVPYTPDGHLPSYQLHAGRPALPDPDYTYWRNGKHYVGEHPEHGPLFRIRVGTKIDITTGEKTRVIVPLSGSKYYLDTFANGEVFFDAVPDFHTSQYILPDTDDIDALFELYRYFPVTTHGHESPSPDFNYKAADGNFVGILDVKEVTLLNSIRVPSTERNSHLHWTVHPRFMVGWTRAWHSESFMRPDNASVIFQFFTDGTYQPIFDKKQRINTDYSGGDHSMQSPDATKIHTSSAMTGRDRNYIAVMARPRPPENVLWSTSGGAVELRWEAPLYHKEIRGYLVYRSERSGDGYQLLTPEPVTGFTWRDENVESGKPYYYVLTSLEHSGLESGYSNEAARAGVQLSGTNNSPLVVYAEAENAIKDLYTDAMPGLAMGVDRWNASDWYYLYRHPQMDRGEASLPVHISHPGDYYVWTRIRSADGEPAQWSLTLDGAESFGEAWQWNAQTNRWDTTPASSEPTATDSAVVNASTEADTWTWVRAGNTPLSLSTGTMEMTFATQDANAQMDIVALATDSSFHPEGPRPEKATPPEPPSALTVENVRDRTNHLTWAPATDPTFSHFNVYASREPITEVSQELLRGSPTRSELIDWGLRANTRYYYAVTTVDRRGNESNPTLSATNTPPRSTPERTIELAFSDANLEGPFEKTSSAGIRGSAYLVPQDPSNNSVSWEIDIPSNEDYYLWLRYLHRGDGSYGNSARQEVRAVLNGEVLTVLGAFQTGRAGETDLNIPDKFLDPEHPLADRVWTWMHQGRNVNLEPVRLPSGRNTIKLENLHQEIRYDVLLITNEPSFTIPDGRKRQIF